MNPLLAIALPKMQTSVAARGCAVWYRPSLVTAAEEGRLDACFVLPPPDRHGHHPNPVHIGFPGHVLEHRFISNLPVGRDGQADNQLYINLTSVKRDASQLTSEGRMISEVRQRYARSSRTELHLVVRSCHGNFCLASRPAHAPLFGSFSALPTARIPDDSTTASASETVDALRPAAETALEGLFGTLPPFEMRHLGAFELPALSPQQVFVQLIEVSLDSEPPLREGEWISPRDALVAWNRHERWLDPTAAEYLRHWEVAASVQSNQLSSPVPLPVARPIPPKQASRGSRSDAWVDWKGVLESVAVTPQCHLLPLRTPTIPPATHTNCYSFGAKTFVLIDPGSPFPAERARLEQFIERRCSGGATLTAVLLTHHHIDHVAGAARIRKRFQVPILAHREAVSRLPPRLRVDQYLEDQEPFQVGDEELVAYWTPGHARGHLCFFHARSGVLVSGDLVAGWGTIVIAPPDGNLAQYLHSLARVRDLNPRVIAPAHGPPLRDARQVLNEYTSHRNARTRQVLEAVRGGHDSIAAITRRVYAGLPPLVQRMARVSTEAHLEFLVEERRVLRVGRRYRPYPTSGSIKPR